MSNMKNLLGDMCFEEFEEVRKETIDKFKGKDNIVELCCREKNVLYKCWMYLDGKALLNEWLLKHKAVSDTVFYMDLMQYLGNSFIEWLEGIN